jgi:hypothetical protein
MDDGRNLGTEFKDGLTDRLVAVIRSVEATDDWQQSRSVNETHLYILRAARNVGVLEPFDKEQSALNSYLQFKRADRKMCDYAWRLLAQSL